MKKWIKSFFAVDNNVNEQTVVGVYLLILSTVVVIAHITGSEKAGIDVIISLLSAMLLCFGISGFKRI